MWDSISKPPQYVGSAITDFFEIQYAALPHYEEKSDDFVADAVVLRRRCVRREGRAPEFGACIWECAVEACAGSHAHAKARRC